MIQREPLDWVRLVCARTGMPAAARQKLEAAARTAFSPKVWQAAEGLTDPDRAQQSWECLKSLPPDQWPEKTRLQKAIEAHVCAGGKIGSARGRLK